MNLGGDGIIRWRRVERLWPMLDETFDILAEGCDKMPSVPAPRRPS